MGITIPALSLGAFMTASQIILLRELMCVFSGNEFSVGITLGVWLLSLSLGSFASSLKTVRKFLSDNIIFAAFIQFLLVCAAVFILRGFSSATAPGPYRLVFMTFAVLFAPCFLFGCFFAVLAGCCSTGAPGEAAGRVYISESAGDAAGGLAVSLLFLPFLGVFVSLFIFGIMFLLSMLFVEKNRLGKTAAAFCSLALLILLLTGAADKAEKYTLGRSIKHTGNLQVKDTKYQRIAVAAHHESVTVFSDGLPAWSWPSGPEAEYYGLLPLLVHPSPSRVLFIGGSPVSPQKASAFPGVNITFVQPDPELFKILKRIKAWEDVFSNSRVEALSIEPLSYLLRTRRDFDCVILNVPSPVSAEKNRFYTKEFFRTVSGKLKENGIVFLGVDSSAGYLSGSRKILLGTIYATLKSVFKNVAVFPADGSYFMASDMPLDSITGSRIIELLRRKNIETEFIEGRAEYDLNPRRINWFLSEIISAGRVNSVFSPSAYMPGLALWASMFSFNIPDLYGKAASGNLPASAALIFAAVFFILRRRKTLTVAFAVTETGFAAMSGQLLIMLSFQILYGSLFHMAGILIAVFMAGLIAGGFFSTRAVRTDRGNVSTLGYIKLIQTVFPFFIVLAVYYFSRNTGFRVLGENFVFPALSFASGALTGSFYPLSNRILIIETKGNTAGWAGKTYALDLAGSLAGAVLIPLAVLPAAGLPLTCLILSSASAASALFLFNSSKTA